MRKQERKQLNKKQIPETVRSFALCLRVLVEQQNFYYTRSNTNTRSPGSTAIQDSENTTLRDELH